MSKSPDEVFQRIVALGEDWAEKESAASLLEESRRSVRSQISIEYFPESKTAAKAEMMAESDDIYIQHIKSMVEARRVANVAKVNYDGARVWAELIRTQEATRRAEMTLR